MTIFLRFEATFRAAATTGKMHGKISSTVVRDPHGLFHGHDRKSENPSIDENWLNDIDWYQSIDDQSRLERKFLLIKIIR